MNGILWVVEWKIKGAWVVFSVEDTRAEARETARRGRDDTVCQFRIRKYVREDE